MTAILNLLKGIKARHFLFVLAAVGLALVASGASAQAVTQPDAKFDGLLSLIQQNSEQWNGKLQGYALHLFWTLAVIQLVMTFFPMVLRQAELGEIAHELVKYVLVIGFFYEILAHSTYWASAVIQSFRDAGGAAIGQPSAMQPSDIFALAVEFANTIGNVHTINPLAAFSITIASACVLLSFAFIAAFMAVTLVESYIVINASVLLLGFGGSQWTREYALAMLKYAVAVGAKLFVLTLLVGLIAQSAHDWQAAYNHTDNASMWTMVGLGFTCAYLAKTIPDLIQGLISGVSFGGGGALGGMAATALGVGAGVGAAAAASGLGGAAAMAGEAASAGQAAGLANLINDSIAGGSQPPTATGQMDMDGVKAGAATLSPRTGGNTQSANRPATAPASGSASAGASRAAKAISSVASGTAVAASMVGKLAALSVPGMEGAAALPAGGPRQMPSGGSEGDDTRPPVNFRDENLIRPAEPAPFSQSSAAKPPKE
jgi:type IV secretion system protein TrbL